MGRRRAPLAVAAAAVGALLVLSGPTGVSAAPAPSADPKPGPITKPFQQVPKQVAGAATARSAMSAQGKGVNPYIGMPTDPSKVDYAYWRAAMKAQSTQRAKQQAAARATARRMAGLQPTQAEPLLVDEAEPDAIRGGNDSQATAQFIPRFGTGAGERPAARILGTLAAGPAARTITVRPEDNGAIPLATETGIRARTAVTATSTIGDGPHGSAGDGTGDFDYFALRGLTAGQRLIVDTDTPTSDLDSVLILFAADGTVVAANDDDGQSFDSRIAVTVPADGDYFAAAGGFPTFPADPFDSGSGGGAGSEGAYTVTLGLDTVDLDHYSVSLEAGDVVGASVTGAGTEVVMFDPSGRNVIGSTQDASFIYPGASPLPGGGNAVLALVAPRAGRYALLVTGGTGSYDTTLEVYRPGPEHLAANATQTIFLDFDGARVNTGIFGGPGVRQLSPLSAFLGRWGLTAAQENALINRIVQTTTENLQRDFGANGVKVRVLNSRDHADAFGQPNVSRIVVGGTIDESGIGTIGIAQSIDPGNFETEETALVLLDVLSSAPGEFAFPGDPDPSLNAYLTPASNRVKFVGTAVGNVVSHEAGHYLGSFHVDQFNPVLNLMDQGGNYPLLFGVGPDGVGGTADDPDVDFGEDVYNPNEGFTGIENTKANTRWGLSPRR